MIQIIFPKHPYRQSTSGTAINKAGLQSLRVLCPFNDCIGTNRSDGLSQRSFALLADGIVQDHKSAVHLCESEILPSIRAHGAVSIVRVFSISKGGVDREDEGRLRAQPL